MSYSPYSRPRRYSRRSRGTPEPRTRFVSRRPEIRNDVNREREVSCSEEIYLKNKTIKNLKKKSWYFQKECQRLSQEMAAMEEETPPVQAPMPIVQASVPLYKIIYSCPQECATKSDCINQLSSQVKELRQNIQTESSRHASELQQVHRRYQEEILKVKMDAKARSELQDSRLRESEGRLTNFTRRH